MEKLVAVLISLVLALGTIQEGKCHRDQPLSGIAIHRTLFDLNEQAYTVLGSDLKLSLFYIRNKCKLLITISNFSAYFQGQHSQWVLVEYSSPHPSDDDWIGVFSPGDFK